MREIKGWVDICLTDSYGNILEERHGPNTIQLAGHAHVADQLSAASETAMGFMGIGTGSGQGTGDTTLGTEINRNTLESGYPSQGAGGNDYQVIYKGFWTAGTGTGAITEAGIFNMITVDAGKMLAYQSFSVINKGASDKLTITWTLDFTG